MSRVFNVDLIKQKYASFTDAELLSSISFEQELKAKGFHPETLDLRKRGFDPAMCDFIIAEYQFELDRRHALAPA